MMADIMAANALIAVAAYSISDMLVKSESFGWSLVYAAACWRPMNNFSWEAPAVHGGFHLGFLMPIRGLQLAAKQLASCEGLLMVFAIAHLS